MGPVGQTRADLDRLRRIESEMEADLDRSEAELRALVEARPDDLEALLLLMRLCFRRSGFEEMGRAASQALALVPDSPRALGGLALSAYYLGDLAEAAAQFARLAEVLPDFATYARLACCLHRLGRLEEALAAADASLSFCTEKRERFASISHYLAAQVLLDLGRHDQADRRLKALGGLYRTRPLAIASTLLGFTNRMDFHEWDRFRKKQEISLAVRDYCRAEGPKAFPYHPDSYVMPQDAEAFRDAAAAGRGGPIWIVKPTSLFGGQGMRLVEGFEAVPCDEGTVVQDYVANPLLVGGRKAHVRLYLMITSIAPLRAYFWRQGIVRLAPEAYRPAPGWLDRPGIHITNTALHKDHPELRLSQDPQADDAGNVWSLSGYIRHIVAAGGDEALVWQRLTDLVHGFLKVIAHSGLFARQAEGVPARSYPPKFLGMDVLLDAELRPWLLESQRMPGQTGTPLVDRVNGELFRTITEMIAAPMGAGAVESLEGRLAELEMAHRGAFVRLEPSD